ncbi:IS3 family transposase [Corynebacterium vitaeruminis]|uniref:IS3 family transposase n=1 Tax=Corynebacterium vitaeruminis TaxID=38305 RepID=UPI001E29FD84|nr:IS3 family transposase [Corynebacterium vitaeruminis]
MCRVLKDAGIKIAPSTYYARINHTPSNRDKRDEILMNYLNALFTSNFYVYGARKLHALINKDHHLASHGQGHVARCTVERLMKKASIRGPVRRKHPNTTYTVKKEQCPADLVDRNFHVPAPNMLWVADITYVRTHVGWVYTAFITDAYSRRIVGWKVSAFMYTDLVVDTLTMAIDARCRAGQRIDQLIHHSDRGVQYRAIAYGQRLEENQIIASVGSKGDSYDNALAEPVNSLYKGECIHNIDQHPAGFRHARDVEQATAAWVGWYNNDRLHSRLGNTSPVEYENAYWASLNPVQTAA